MKILTIILLLIPLLFSCSTEKKFDFPINEIESIKEYDYQNKPYYGYLQLTPETYYSNSDASVQDVTAAFLYKGEKASLKISVNYETNFIVFSSLGVESDYFVFAISELFEEPLSNAKMKESIECSFYDGEPSDRSLLSSEQQYKISYKPNSESFKGHLSMVMAVNLTKGEILIEEKNSGIAKKNFVNAFAAK